MAGNSKNARREVKKLLEEAYNFGYFVGYRGHSEWISWVGEKKSEIYEQAKELGVYDLIKEAYNRGKADGARKRTEEINLGLIEKGRLTEEKPSRPKVEMPATPERVSETRERLEVEFARFLETTKLILPPEFLDTLKHLDLPKMLKLEGE